MGRPKLLLPLGGRSVVRRVAENARATARVELAAVVGEAEARTAAEVCAPPASGRRGRGCPRRLRPAQGAGGGGPAPDRRVAVSPRRGGAPDYSPRCGEAPYRRYHSASPSWSRTFSQPPTCGCAYHGRARSAVALART